MKDLQKKLRVALVQATPVMFDKGATIDKVCAQIREAGQNGAELIVFPESLIPCYPYGLTYGFTVGSRIDESLNLTNGGPGKSTMTTPFSAPARTPTASARQRKRRALTSPSAIQSGAATTAPSTALI